MSNNFLEIEGVGSIDMSKCSERLLFILNAKPNNLTWADYIDGIRSLNFTMLNNRSLNTREGFPDLSFELDLAIIKNSK
jgi:hypothetical protein